MSVMITLKFHIRQLSSPAWKYYFSLLPQRDRLASILDQAISNVLSSQNLAAGHMHRTDAWTDGAQSPHPLQVTHTGMKDYVQKFSS